MSIPTLTAPGRKYALTPSEVRRVWAAVTVEPGISTRALARRLGQPHTRTAAALVLLRDLGYVEYPPGAQGARRVVVPLYVAP